MTTAIRQLAEVYELAARELGDKELRAFMLSEGARMRELTLPADLDQFLEEHVLAAKSLLQNLLALPGRRRRRPNLLSDILNAIMWLFTVLGASRVWDALT